MKKILVVEDEIDISEVIAFNLAREGFEVLKAYNGVTALQLVNSEKPDLILLDLMLPDMSGFDICKVVKASDVSPKVIMLTAKGDESNIIAGLELGADDYITKPFSMKILLARIKSVLRRSKEGFASENLKKITIKSLEIDTVKHKVTLAEQELDLTATEFKLLYFLASNPGSVYTRDQIIHSIHGTDYPVTKRSIDVQITALRKKLEGYGDYVETIRGVGYRFKEIVG